VIGAIPRWQPWLVWGIGALAFCYAFFQRVAPSVMIDPLMRDLAVGGAILGNLSAFYYYAYAGLQIPVGLLIDRYGPRLTMTCALSLAALGSLVFAQAESLILAYTGRTMVGLGVAFAYVGSLKLATNWFEPRRFALVAGLTMGAGMLGGVSAQYPLAHSVDAFGWRGTMLAAAIMAAVLAAATWLLVRDRPGSRATESAAERAARMPFLMALKHVLGNPQNWLIAAVAASMTAPLLAFAGLWGVAWLMQVHGLARPDAAGFTSTLFVGWAVGSPLVGWLSDRLGWQRRLLRACALGGLLGMLIILFVPLPLILLALVYALTGAMLGGMVMAFALAGAANPPAVSGAAYAFVNTAGTATGALFQPLIGWLLDRNWSGEEIAGARLYDAEAYMIAFSVLPAFLLVGIICSFLIRAGRAR
jgi:MFS family permease